MDKIFAKAFEAKAKSKKPDQPEAEKPKAPKEGKKSEVQKKAIKKPTKSKNVESNVNPSRRQKTDDGYVIYKEDELKLGTGGDTPDCPFDCKCCF